MLLCIDVSLSSSIAPKSSVLSSLSSALVPELQEEVDIYHLGWIFLSPLFSVLLPVNESSFYQVVSSKNLQNLNYSTWEYIT